MIINATASDGVKPTAGVRSPSPAKVDMMPMDGLPGSPIAAEETMAKTHVTLTETILDLLQKYGTPELAAPAFTTLIEKSPELRRETVLRFLQLVAPTLAPKVSSRRRSGPYRRPAKVALPTVSQKKANVAVARAYAHEVFARKLRGGKTLGDIEFRQLRTHAHTSARAAVQFFDRGYEDAVDVFGCMALANHVQPDDPFKPVKDIFKAATVIEVYEQARIDAADAIAHGSAKIAEDLLTAAAGRKIGNGMTAA